MTDAVLVPNTEAQDTRDIVLDEVFPHAPSVVWKALTTGALIARWLMPPTDFAPVEGCHFTFQTTPAGAWDGVIRCQVLEVIENQRFAYAWTGGDAANVGYGSRLDTVVTWVLSPTEAGTRVKLVHSGFVLPRNDSAYRNMSNGWKTVVQRLDGVLGEETQR